MTNYAHAPRTRVDHIVKDKTTTRCGLDLKGMAVWPARYTNRVNIRPTCETCRSTR